MADQQYSQYPAGQAGYSYGSYTGDSSYSQSGYVSTNTGAYTVESSFLQLSREKSAIQTQLEEVLKKYKVAVALMSIDQNTISEQNQQIADLKQVLHGQLSEVRHRFKHLVGQSEDTHNVRRLDGKVRDLESRLELEQTTRSLLEVESSFLQLSREKSAIQTQLQEVLKYYTVTVALIPIVRKELLKRYERIADLKQVLKDQLSEVSHKFEHLAGESEDTHNVHRLDGKVRDLESKLELEQTTRSLLEVESSFLQLSREKSAIQTQLEEVRKKYKVAEAIISVNEETLLDQNKGIADSETEKRILEDKLSELRHKFEHLAGQSEDTHKELKLELEQTSRSRLQNCTICFEPLTSSNEHRIVSLRCGHLFGQSCISRWLEEKNARCPQCKARARKAEIINIYAKSFQVLDTSKRDKSLEDLAKEVTARRNAEITAAEERVKHSLAVQENERLKKELMDAQKQLQEYRSRYREPLPKRRCQRHSKVKQTKISLS